MKHFYFLILFLALIISACAKPVRGHSTQSAPSVLTASKETNLNMTWIKFPTESGFGSFLLVATESKTSLLKTDLATPQVTLWMPSMGHGSSPVKISELSPGVFLIEKVFFSMHGEWEIRFLIPANNQEPDQHITWPIEF